MSEIGNEGFEPKAILPSREKLGETATLEDFLTHSLKEPGFVRYDELPQKIDLGEHAERINQIRQLSEDDPSQAEYATSLVLNWEENKYSFTDNVRGDENSVHHSIDLTQDQYLAADMHTHGAHDISFSPTDIQMLFSSEKLTIPLAASVVITPSANMVIVRTDETPHHLPEDITNFPNANEVQDRMHWLTRMAQKYHLKIYSSPPDQQVLLQAS